CRSRVRATAASVAPFAAPGQGVGAVPRLAECPAFVVAGVRRRPSWARAASRLRPARAARRPTRHAACPRPRPPTVRVRATAASVAPFPAPGQGVGAVPRPAECPAFPRRVRRDVRCGPVPRPRCRAVPRGVRPARGCVRHAVRARRAVPGPCRVPASPHPVSSRRPPPPGTRPGAAPHARSTRPPAPLPHRVRHARPPPFPRPPARNGPQGLRRAGLRAVMANVVGDGAAERSTRTLRAESALRTIAADQESPERVRRVLEQALVFAGAAFAALYTPGADDEALCLVESVGVPRHLYGVRDSYPLGSRFPAAEAVRTGRPVWLGPKELAEHAHSRRVPARDFFLAALPVREGSGCLLAVSERPDGFDHDDRTGL